MNYCKIILRNLQIYTQIGVYEDEKIEKDFFLDIEVNLNLWKEIIDDLLHTVNTKDIENAVRRFVTWKNFDLIEYAASWICDEILSMNKIQSCKVVLNKPWCLKFTENVVVEVYKIKE